MEAQKENGIVIGACDKDCWQCDRCRRLYFNGNAFCCYLTGNIHLASSDANIPELLATLKHETLHLVIDRVLGFPEGYIASAKLDNTKVWFEISGERRYWREVK